MKRQLIRLYLVILCMGLSSLIFPSNAPAAGKQLEILTSTFPIHQITQNVARGRSGVYVSLMLPAQLGCPHDYVLTPQDMQKISRADVLVINGLGMEEFLGAPVTKVNSRLKIIDSSAGINNILYYTDEEEHEKGHHENEKGHHHHHGVNPHLFASPRMAARLAVNIADGLAKVDPEGARLYRSNARAYAAAMNRLADECSALGKRLKNNRIVTQHGVFDYLARDMGLRIVAVVQAHAGQDPSAAEMLAIIRTIKREKAGAIFTEPQYPAKTGRTLAREAGISAASLDPVATGPENAPLTYYETVMRRNLAVLGQTLGTR